MRRIALKYSAENNINAVNWQVKNVVVKLPVFPTAIEGVGAENDISRFCC